MTEQSGLERGGDTPAATYILPLKRGRAGGLGDLPGYLQRVLSWAAVLVVDGSPPEVFEEHARLLPAGVVHLRPDVACLNGKVSGVLTGIRHARTETLVIADDDVRYTVDSFRRVVDLLQSADVVRPQNYFSDLPWHARWDTARTLINRAFGSDYPGTLVLRRSTLQLAGGYSGNVLFENLELLRTIRAAGGRELRADDLFVPRVPCSVPHFRRQRVRQAYDDFAQPVRLAVELALLPATLVSLRKPARLAVLAVAGILAAEAGRRRAHGTGVFTADAALWAPLWMLERALCVWLAVGWRLRGGIPYGGARLRTAGHSVRRIRGQAARGHCPRTAFSVSGPGAGVEAAGSFSTAGRA